MTTVQPTSLSPDGRYVALPQADRVILVDLATARVTTVDLLGFNVRVLWSEPRTLLVQKPDRTYRVDAVSGAATRLAGAPALADTAPSAGGADPLVELPAADPTVLREWPGGAEVRLQQYHIQNWHGPAWRDGELVVRATTGAVVAANATTGAVVRVLLADLTPLGWLDPRTVLVRTATGGVLAWSLDTGRVTAVSGPFDGVIAV